MTAGKDRHHGRIAQLGRAPRTVHAEHALRSCGWTSKGGPHPPRGVWHRSRATRACVVRSTDREEVAGSNPAPPARGTTFACFHNPANDSKQDGSRERPAHAWVAHWRRAGARSTKGGFDSCTRHHYRYPVTADTDSGRRGGYSPARSDGD